MVLPNIADRKQTDWRSIYVLTLINFLMSLLTSTVTFNLWAYITELDSSITSTFFGYMLSFSSGCNVLATFVAGYVANLISHTLPAMILGKIATILGCLLLLSIEFFQAQLRFILIVMEGAFGIGAGLISVSRAQISSLSLEQDRSRAVSTHNIALTIGITLGLVLMMLLSMLKYPGIEFVANIHLNMFTIPVYFVILCSMCAVGLLGCCYNGQLKATPIIISQNLEETISPTKSPSYDALAVVICCMTKIFTGLSMVFITAVNNIYLMQVFRWTSVEYVFYSSIINGINGFSGVVLSLLYICGVLQQWLSPRQGIVISIIFQLIFYFLNYPWWFLVNRMQYEIREINAFNKSVVVVPGCSITQSWCTDTPAINVYVYCTLHIICLSVALPLMLLNIEILFSTILGPIKQGTQFGIFLVCGEILNVVGPVVMTQVYEISGPRYIWSVLIATHVLVLLAWCVFYSRMIPYSQRLKQQVYNKNSANITRNRNTLKDDDSITIL